MSSNTNNFAIENNGEKVPWENIDNFFLTRFFSENLMLKFTVLFYIETGFRIMASKTLEM